MSNENHTNLMLINATHQEELRVAIVSNNRLENIYIENAKGAMRRKGDIYKARITRIEPSLQAAFVDFGSERHGFLPFKEIASSYFQHTPDENKRVDVSEMIKDGQEIIIQIVKGERGNKGAALTTYITLAGCYLVLMPNNPRAGGISRRIEGDEREQLKNILNALQLPDEMGLIVRTAGVDKSLEELEWDLEILLKLWEAINDTSDRAAPFLIHRESDILTRAIRDYLRKDTDAILIDNPKVFNDCQKHIEQIRPEFADRVQLYEDKTPIFTKHGIETQIETAFQHEVRLPSGGFIVIQGTEAMVAIDVNSAQDTKGDNIEETAFNTNYEAAVEIARQLRLRDIGGLVVIDFIDMENFDNQKEIQNIFSQEVQTDKARVQYNRISKFGLLEVSRQRLRPSLSEANQIVCPRCDGQGTIRNVESLAFFILRNIRQDLTNPAIGELRIQVPVEVASYLLNEKRSALIQFEQNHEVNLKIIPNPYFETPHYKIDKFNKNQVPSMRRRPSYKSTDKPTMPDAQPSSDETLEVPAITAISTPVRPAASAPQPVKVGLFKRMWQYLFGTPKKKPAPPKRQPHHHNHKHKGRSGDQRRRNHHGNGGGRRRHNHGGGHNKRPHQGHRKR